MGQKIWTIGKKNDCAINYLRFDAAQNIRFPLKYKHKAFTKVLVTHGTARAKQAR